MINNILYTILVTILFLNPTQNFAQAPNLGTAAEFALFTSNGAVQNVGISQVTGNVGTNTGSSTGFGNVNGVMHDINGASGQCAADLLIAYNHLNSAIPDSFLAPALGGGQILTAGIYNIAAATTLNLDLTLDAQNNTNAIFIFQIQGAFAAGYASKVHLINGALACNVFWKVEGSVNIAAASTMRGTIIANNAAIAMNAGDTLEGRALSTTGAINIDGVLVYTPAGCGSPVLLGPTAPTFGVSACFTIFSSDGPVTNFGISNVGGNVGSNNGLTTGFDPLLVTGSLHPIPDGATAQCSADLLIAYNYINTIPSDIELLYPPQFGRNLVLTPHTYVMNGSVTFTDTLYLNAQGNPNAVFVIQINGALSTSTFSNVILMNGAKSKNVYWKVEGAVSINDNSTFRGTIICNNGAINLGNVGVVIDGRTLTTTGAITTIAIDAAVPITGCAILSTSTLYDITDESIAVFPNPFHSSITITLKEVPTTNKYQFIVFNALGEQVLNTPLYQESTHLEMNNLAVGIYFYKVVANGKVLQSGKLVAL